MGIMVIAMIFRAEPRKRLSQPLRTTWLKANEGVHWIDSLIWIMLYSACWQRSSVVEQRTHKPLVVGSNPSAATFLSAQPSGFEEGNAVKTLLGNGIAQLALSLSILKRCSQFYGCCSFYLTPHQVCIVCGAHLHP